jgi:anti-sigma factor RsiW
MNCSELEALLCDHLDGTLPPGQEAEVKGHLAQCPSCAEMARDCAAVVALAGRAAEVEPPPELVTRILFDLAANREKSLERQRGPWALLGHLLGPVLQPRFAMGMAMTILSFSMLARFAGINVRQLSLSDLDPVKVWQTADNRVHRTWTRAVQFYESLRFVYDIRSRLGELTAEDNAGGAEGAPPANADKGAKSKRQGGRAQ